jgi:hypothetical protein
VKSREIASIEEAENLEAILRASASKTCANLRRIVEGAPSALGALARFKFEPTGCDPLDPERSLNLIEQLNQTFTYLASFRAAGILLAEHPRHAPLCVNLGTAPGTDIESSDRQVAAEVFASVDPKNNRKLEGDVARMEGHTARFRYVFYLSPGESTNVAKFRDSPVTLRWLDFAEILP